jgi:hypothetical protein
MGSFSITSDFEKKLDDLGMSYKVYDRNLYLLRHNNDVGRTFKVRLICSDHADELEHGSRNGNNIQSIGVFKFKLLTADSDTDFYILGFSSSSYQRMDFAIIPAEKLKRRVEKKNQISTANHRVSIVFWLMDDRFLYDCTNVGIEWEWFYLSKGLKGRMVDGTEWDYSECLNDWNRLTMK